MDIVASVIGATLAQRWHVDVHISTDYQLGSDVSLLSGTKVWYILLTEHNFVFMKNRYFSYITNFTTFTEIIFQSDLGWNLD